MNNTDAIKKAVGAKAAELIEDGMIVGLGSGSTAAYFIESLIARTQQGLKIYAVSSSRASLKKAEQGGILINDINEVTHIDITVDGADEIDPKKRMIKGGGGAHVREKILAKNSNEMVVIIDETKLVSQLGSTRNLPVEVLFFGSPATRRRIENLGYEGKWRLSEDGDLYITENGNLLFDIHFSKPPQHPEEIHQELIDIPGVLDTGFFFNLAGRVIIGYDNGKVEIRP